MSDIEPDDSAAAFKGPELTSGTPAPSVASESIRSVVAVFILLGISALFVWWLRDYARNGWIGRDVRRLADFVEDADRRPAPDSFVPWFTIDTRYDFKEFIVLLAERKAMDAGEAILWVERNSARSDPVRYVSVSFNEIRLPFTNHYSVQFHTSADVAREEDQERRRQENLKTLRSR